MKEEDLLFTPISEKIDIDQVREHSKLSPETLAKNKLVTVNLKPS